jgi:hypothetical protein
MGVPEPRSSRGRSRDPTQRLPAFTLKTATTDEEGLHDQFLGVHSAIHKDDMTLRGLLEEQTADLLFPFDTVWDAARRVFELAQWRVKKADKVAGHYEVLVNIPTDQLALPDPLVEKFQVDITRIDANSTKVHAAIRFDQWHWGTTAYYVNSFFAELQKQLDSRG